MSSAEQIAIRNYLIELFKIFGFLTDFSITIEGTFVLFKLTNFHIFQPRILTPKIIDQILYFILEAFHQVDNDVMPYKKLEFEKTCLANLNPTKN